MIRQPSGLEQDRGRLRAATLDVLVADDDEGFRATLEDMLRAAGHAVTTAADGAEAIAILHDHRFDVAICDIRLPQIDGLGVLRRLRRDSPTTAVIMMTGYGRVPDAVRVLREGASDYLVKPFDGHALLRHLDRTAERVALWRELEAAREQFLSRAVGGSLIGQSHAIKHLCHWIEVLAPGDAPLVITGESGTGKELVARTIHARGPRRDRPFVVIDCATSPREFLERDLFGDNHDAVPPFMGPGGLRFQKARGGTLLLDEVGEIPRPLQARLALVIECGAHNPRGGDSANPAEARIIATTRRDLGALVGSSCFNHELFLRLNVLELTVPSLRTRKSDLVSLAAYFLRRLTPDGTRPPRISRRAWAALVKYSYPGKCVSSPKPSGAPWLYREEQRSISSTYLSPSRRLRIRRVKPTESPQTRHSEPRELIRESRGARFPGCLRVLVVEAEEDLRPALRACIEEMGHACTTAKDGVQAWDLHRARPFDVILSDWVLPRMDGAELCRKMRADERQRHTHFIFMTSLGDKAHIAQAFRDGADEYITKPFHPDELSARLASAARLTALHRGLLKTNAALRRDSERSLRIAHVDPLTGVGNRLRLSEDLTVARERAPCHGHPHCIALCDLDHFKSYNDRFGHLAGDEILRRVAATLRENLRGSDEIYRYGGDEFLVLLPEQSLKHAAKAMDRMRRGVEALPIVHDAVAVDRGVTMSVGIADS